MNEVKFTPLGDRIVARINKVSETEGGIIMPDSVNKNPSGVVEATVLATGPGFWNDGKIKPVDVQVGDVVAFQMESSIALKTGTGKWQADALVVLSEQSILVKHSTTGE